MSNPQHPQFASARPLAAAAAPVVAVDATAHDERSTHDGARAAGAAIGLAGLGLWAFLIAELASKFSPPTIF